MLITTLHHAILIHQDGMEKQFISCHSKTVFELLDQDNDNHISIEEFETFGFAFNFRVSLPFIDSKSIFG